MYPTVFSTDKSFDFQKVGKSQIFVQYILLFIYHHHILYNTLNINALNLHATLAICHIHFLGDEEAEFLLTQEQLRTMGITPKESDSFYSCVTSCNDNSFDEYDSAMSLTEDHVSL